MNKKLIECFQKLDENLAPNIELNLRLNQGLPVSSILDTFNEIGVYPTKDLIQVYHWHNGLRFEKIPGGKISFTSVGIFYPLETSVKEYKNLKGKFYSEDYFPIFWDDQLLINLNQSSSCFGKIFIFSPSLLTLEPIPIYDSLFQMFMTINKCFEVGCYKFDTKNMLVIDYDKEKVIAQEINKEASKKYWSFDWE